MYFTKHHITMAKEDQTRTTKRKAAMLEALEKTLGIVTDAAKMAQIHRRTHYTWMREDAEYREAVGEIDEVAIDFAESCLFQQMRDGVGPSTTFYLKYRARKRGYVERKEITGADGEPLIKYVDPTKLSTEAIREYLNAVNEGDD